MMGGYWLEKKWGMMVVVFLLGINAFELYQNFFDFEFLSIKIKFILGVLAGATIYIIKTNQI